MVEKVCDYCGEKCFSYVIDALGKVDCEECDKLAEPTGADPDGTVDTGAPEEPTSDNPDVSIFTSAPEEPSWVDKHSVNCIDCNKLFDEREGITPESGEGTLCDGCVLQREYKQLAEKAKKSMKKRIIVGIVPAEEQAVALIKASRFFTVTPLPDNVWEFDVKTD